MQSAALLPLALYWGSEAAGGWRQPAQGGERHRPVLLRATAGNGALGEMLQPAPAALLSRCLETLQHRGGHTGPPAMGGRSGCRQGAAHRRMPRDSCLLQVQDGHPLQLREECDLSPWEHFVQEPGREAMLWAGDALGAVDVSLPGATPGVFTVQ